MRAFPGGPEVKNLPCNAGDEGSIPGWRTKIPHAMEQTSLCAATIEPMPHLESPLAARKDPARWNEDWTQTSK